LRQIFRVRWFLPMRQSDMTIDRQPVDRRQSFLSASPGVRIRALGASDEGEVGNRKGHDGADRVRKKYWAGDDSTAPYLAESSVRLVRAHRLTGLRPFGPRCAL